MAGKSTIKVNIVGDSSGLRRAFGQASKEAQGFGSKARRVAKGLRTAFFAGGAAFAGAAILGKGFYDAAIESQKIAKQTEAVIKSTGGAAGVTAKQVDDLASSLSMKTGVDDELIASGQNVLLTFTNIRNEAGKGNDIFTQATKTALDMSVALGTDLKGANIQLGKALNDPVKGISALSRVGVSFTEQQKEQIKALVASGDTMGAQKIILAELQKEFGGSAEAQATAGDKLRVVWGNIQEELGKKLVPIVEKVATWLADKLPDAMKAAERWAKKLGRTFKSIGTWLGDHKEVLVGVGAAIASILVAAFLAWAASAASAAAATLAATWPVLAVAAAIGLLVAGFMWAYKNVGWFKTAVDALVKFFREKLVPAFMWLWGVIKAVFGWVKKNWRLVLAILTGPIGAAVLIIQKHWQTIKNAVKTAFDFIKRLWAGIKEALADPIRVAVGIITSVISGIGSAFTRVRDTIGGIIVTLVGWFESLPGKISSAVGGMFDGIKSAFRAALNWVINKWNSLEFKIGGQKVFGVSMPGVTIGTPDLPTFHQGGVVPGKGEVPIMALGGERVLSLADTRVFDTALALASRTPVTAQGDTYNIYVNKTNATPEQIVGALEEYKRRNGRKLVKL